MTKREKLLERIKRNPKNVRFETLRKVLEWYGFEVKRTRGSHFSFVKRIEGRKRVLVVPYTHPLKAVYVKQALALIAVIEGESPTDDSQDA